MSGPHWSRFAAAILVALSASGAAALAPDERARERIAGDDDPISLPSSVLAPRAQLGWYDPETTGSVARRPAKSKGHVCERFAFDPEKPLDEQFRQVC